MTYKTILVHVDDTPQAGTRVSLASDLALACDAHLIGASATGVSRLFYQEGSADLLRTALAPYMDERYRKTERLLADFAGRAARAGVSSCEQRLVDDEEGAALITCARYADLVVLGQSSPDTATPPGGELVPYVMLNCPRPLLVVPARHAGSLDTAHVLVAWNGSVQAMRAVSAALPLLRLARRVTVATLGTEGEAADGAGLIAYLARHGVAAGLAAEPTCMDPGARLLALVSDEGAGLLVMGGYGRTRLSELLLGGVTRTLLREMTVPTLLAH